MKTSVIILLIALALQCAQAKPTAAGEGTLAACVKCTGSEGFQKCITEANGDATTTCNCYTTWMQCSIAGCSQSSLDSNYNNCVKQVGPDGRLKAAATCDPNIVCEGKSMSDSGSTATATPTTAPSTPTPTTAPSTPTPNTANPTATPTQSPSPSPAYSSGAPLAAHGFALASALVATLAVLILTA